MVQYAAGNTSGAEAGKHSGICPSSEGIGFAEVGNQDRGGMHLHRNP